MIRQAIGHTIALFFLIAHVGCTHRTDAGPTPGFEQLLENFLLWPGFPGLLFGGGVFLLLYGIYQLANHGIRNAQHSKAAIMSVLFGLGLIPGGLVFSTYPRDGVVSAFPEVIEHDLSIAAGICMLVTGGCLLAQARHTGPQKRRLAILALLFLITGLLQFASH